MFLSQVKQGASDMRVLSKLPALMGALRQHHKRPLHGKLSGT